MFPRGIFIDGDWIADGHFFRRVEKVEKREFIDKFQKDQQDANVELAINSGKFIFGDKYTCVLLSGGDHHWPVQTRLLEMVGVDLEEPDRFTFRFNPEAKMIFIYDEDGDLIGGTMPLRAIGD